MTSWRSVKTAWCLTCNADRPTKRGRIKVDGVGVARRVCSVCSDPVAPGRTKYGNVPTRSRHSGRLFQSKAECNREPALLAEQGALFITGLQYQVPYRLELYSTQAVEALLAYIDESFPTRPPTSLVTVEVDRLWRLVNDVMRSRQCVAKYVSDFSYFRDGQLVVEDVKSIATRTPVYRIKKKLMALCHNVEVIEPKAGGVQQKARGAGVRGVATGSRFAGGR